MRAGVSLHCRIALCRMVRSRACIGLFLAGDTNPPPCNARPLDHPTERPTHPLCLLTCNRPPSRRLGKSFSDLSCNVHFVCASDVCCCLVEGNLKHSNEPEAFPFLSLSLSLFMRPESFERKYLSPDHYTVSSIDISSNPPHQNKKLNRIPSTLHLLPMGCQSEASKSD